MDSSSSCPRFFSDGCGESMQSKLNSPMPWIGMYVAAASALVTIAMAADVFHGFKYRKWWLPSKYLSMNAFSLTVLAVSMKLPVDLTNQMLGVNEILARVSSLALMSTIMANLMTSLGTMESNDIMLNLAAIGTLVITIIVNVSIHISQMLDTVGKGFKHTVTLQIYAEQIACTVFMFILLFMVCDWALIVPYLRRLVDMKYHDLHEKASTKQVKWGDFTIDGLKAVLREYWVNVRIGNPQFLIARLETCAAVGAMCLLTALTLLEAWIRMHFMYEGGANVGASNYKWSINWILIIQTVGVGIGTVAPVSRWFLAAKLKSSKIRQYFFEELFDFEFFGIDHMVDWTEAPLSLKIQHANYRKVLKRARQGVVIFCIIAQYVIVVARRLLLLISAACVKVILLCSPHDESSDKIDSTCAELLDEYAFTATKVESISNEVDKLIEIGKKKQQSEDLIKLLHKSVDFKGVKEFVNDRIQRPNDALYCWSLSIVILTCIAVQIPNITDDEIDELLSGVSEGLRFVNLIEKSLNVKLERYRIGAEDLWIQVRLYHHCERLKVKRQSYEETLHALAEIANRGKYIGRGSEYTSFVLMADRSIEYISSAIIESNKDSGGETEEQLFERISVMISDLLSACLTNLVPLITFKCTSSAIKEREKNVRKAAILLGESQIILETLGKRKLPGLDIEQAAHLNEWRAFMEQNPNWMEQDSENPAASLSAASATIPQSNEEPV